MRYLNRKILGVLLALVTALGVGVAVAPSASASTYRHRWDWSCRNESGTHVGKLTQYWTVVTDFGNRTTYTLNKVVWETDPAFKANRVEALATFIESGDKVMFAFGGSASTLDDVSSGIVQSPGPNIFGSSSNVLNGPVNGTPSLIGDQKFGIWGIGSGATTKSCNDSTANGPVTW